jgi:hypothetical protein
MPNVSWCYPLFTIEKERNAEYQAQIDEYLLKISDAKVSLENDHYQKGIYVLCDIDT